MIISDVFVDSLLKKEPAVIVRVLIVLTICQRLRVHGFDLRMAHFKQIVDELVIETNTHKSGPDDPYIPTSELAWLARAVWDEDPESDWAIWKQRINNSPEPSMAEASKLLAEIVALDFVKSASWRDV
jgi:hypothetical protein